MKSKLKFGIWHPTKTWHIVKPDNIKRDMITICSNKWIDNFPGTEYILPNGTCLSKETSSTAYFNLDHICKNCLKKVDIEDVKTYIIYHKLGIKQ